MKSSVVGDPDLSRPGPEVVEHVVDEPLVVWLVPGSRSPSGVVRSSSPRRRPKNRSGRPGCVGSLRLRLSHTPWWRWMTSTRRDGAVLAAEVRRRCATIQPSPSGFGTWPPWYVDVVLAGLHLDGPDLVGLADGARLQRIVGRRVDLVGALGGEGRRVRDVLRFGRGGRLLRRHLLGRAGRRLPVAVARARRDQDHDADRENGHPLAHGRQPNRVATAPCRRPARTAVPNTPMAIRTIVPPDGVSW